MKQRFYICETCGQMIAMVKPTAVPVKCCGQNMTELEANTFEASTEKHIPVYSVENGKVYVTVGSTEHPMSAEHYIEWISLQTNKGNQRKVLAPDSKPQACFALCEGEEVEIVYAYCNIHGLWANQ